MNSIVSGLQHISNLCGKTDTESLRRWLTKAGRSLPSTHFERKEMSTGNAHKEMPGSGVMYWEEEEMRKSPKGPDYKGFVVLEMDYKAGEKLKIAAWQKPTSRGHNLLALKEDNWSKKKREEEMRDKEVPSNYARKSAGRFSEDDSEIPF
jgi:hypothetical protein